MGDVTVDETVDTGEHIDIAWDWNVVMSLYGDVDLSESDASRLLDDTSISELLEMPIADYT